jgi:hypothetical protein
MNLLENVEDRNKADSSPGLIGRLNTATSSCELREQPTPPQKFVALPRSNSSCILNTYIPIKVCFVLQSLTTLQNAQSTTNQMQTSCDESLNFLILILRCCQSLDGVESLLDAWRDLHDSFGV